MLIHTHITLSLFIALVLVHQFSFGIAFVLIFICAATLPDIDEPRSRIARKIWPLNWLIACVTKHRGILHTMWPALVLGGILSFVVSHELVYAIVGGYLSHLLGDACTRSGIRPFAPLLKLKLRGPIYTGSVTDRLLFWIFGALDIYVFVALF